VIISFHLTNKLIQLKKLFQIKVTSDPICVVGSRHLLYQPRIFDGASQTFFRVILGRPPYTTEQAADTEPKVYFFF